MTWILSKKILLEELGPLYWLLRKPYCLVDNHVYMQQCARKSKVGYKTFFEYKIAQMNESSTSRGQAADKLFWGKDNPDSEQNVLQMTPQEEVLPALFAWRKGHPKPRQRPRTNKSVVRVVTTKVRKTAFKKSKARKAHQAIQADSGNEDDETCTASPNRAEQ